MKVICEGVECEYNMNGECTLEEIYIGDGGTQMFCDSADFPPHK